MKKILTLIILCTLFISCNKNSSKEQNNSDYEISTINKFYQEKEKDKEEIDIEILQVDDITSENFEARKTGLLLFTYYIEHTNMLSQPKDSIQGEYNRYISLKESVGKENKIGKILLTKITTVSKDRVEKTDYIPTILNKKGNIPASIDDLLND